MPDSITEIRHRFDALAREYPLADWARDDLMTRAAEGALEHVLWRKYDGPESERPTEMQVEAMWKAYARAHS